MAIRQKKMNRRERRDAAFWLSRHLAHAIREADLTQTDAAAEAGLSARGVGDFLADGAARLPRSKFAAMHPALAESAVRWTRGWVKCAPERMRSRPCGLCPAPEEFEGPDEMPPPRTKPAPKPKPRG